MRRYGMFALLLALAGGSPGAADEDARSLARQVFQQLIEIDTTDAKGDTTAAAEAMAARLRDAGFPAADVQVLAPEERHGNLVARLRGSGARKPILLLARLDAGARGRQEWSGDPC